MLDEDLVIVRTYPNSVEAELALSALEAAGIHALIRRDDAGGTQPALWTSGLGLAVSPADAEAAAEVLGIEAEETQASDVE
jgi:hypothetical protein